MLKEIAGGITAPKGFKAAGVKAGIKRSGKEDVAIIFSEVPAAVGAVFTQNAMAAAPVVVSRRAAAKGSVRAVVVNSGCANACTGDQGLADAQTMAHIAASLLGVEDHEVIVSSTGIIGQYLPMGKIAAGIENAVAKLSVEGYEDAVLAIMTTDTFSKTCTYEFTLGGKTVRIAGIAKGAGMIHPNMATMLAYVTTDAAINPAVLQSAMQKAGDLSFNMITVDGDTSTNDMAVALANGLAGNDIIDSDRHPDYQQFFAALKQVCIFLAKKVVEDGEGATKLLEIQVQNAETWEDAKTAAMAVAKSPLVKTAFFGEDPNWGRILCAVGYSGAKVMPEKISLAIGGVQIVKDGMGCDYPVDLLKKVMADREITVSVDLATGNAEAVVWTCDLSYEYVKINGEYHT